MSFCIQIFILQKVESQRLEIATILVNVHRSPSDIVMKYRIAGNFRWCKILRKCVYILQKTFEATKLASATTECCSFCVEAFTITKVSRLPPWVRNWHVEQKDSVMLISPSTTSERLFRVCCMAVAG